MWRIIDLDGSGYYLHSSHNKLIIEKETLVLDSIPYVDIHSIIVHGENVLMSNSVFIECAEKCIPIICCDKKHLPSGMYLSCYQHNESGRRYEIQVSTTVPRKKKAWQLIIKAKLKAQSRVLEIVGNLKESKELEAISDSVLSGDLSNREAVGARFYFESLFSQSFSRQNEQDSVNGLLDYGYTILRSAIARAIVSVGLNPSCSVFHSHQVNSFALADDLMEPLRPFVDLKVVELVSQGLNVLNSNTKKALISLISEKILFDGKYEELSYSMKLYCISYYKFLIGEGKIIKFPLVF